MLTKAEVLFEKFCDDRGIAYARIAEGAGRTPDYEIVLADRPVAVEVKQLEPNASDLQVFRDLRTKGHAAGWVNMGRARSAIHEAVKQLRPHAQGRMPGVVVLYNTMGWTIPYLDAYNLAFCLYGPEKAHFAVPDDPALDIQDVGMSRGGRSIATRDHNTTLSALAVLSESGSQGAPELCIYHNIHAALPLATEQCAAYEIPQYRFVSRREGHMPEWVECGV